MTSPFAASQIEQWPIQRLIPYARNARTHSDEKMKRMFSSVDAIRERYGKHTPFLGSSFLARRDRHADDVANALNNLYAAWCEKNSKPRLEPYAFKCTASVGGSQYLPDLRGASRSYFVATTVDLRQFGTSSFSNTSARPLRSINIRWSAGERESMLQPANSCSASTLYRRNASLRQLLFSRGIASRLCFCLTLRPELHSLPPQHRPLLLREPPKIATAHQRVGARPTAAPGFPGHS